MLSTKEIIFCSILFVVAVWVHWRELRMKVISWIYEQENEERDLLMSLSDEEFVAFLEVYLKDDKNYPPDGDPTKDIPAYDEKKYPFIDEILFDTSKKSIKKEIARRLEEDEMSEPAKDKLEHIAMDLKVVRKDKTLTRKDIYEN